MRHPGRQCMEGRKFFCNANALFEPEPLRDILGLQKNAGRLPVVLFQFDSADANRLEPAVAAFIRQDFLAHMPATTEPSIEHFPNCLAPGNTESFRLPK